MIEKYIAPRRLRNDPELEARLKSSAYLSDLLALRMQGTHAVKDAVSTGNIFLQSELNKADTILHMPLEGHTWFRDVPLTNGGGWVTSETSEFVSVGDSNIDGAGAGANDIGVVNYTRSQDVYPAFPWQRSIRIPLIESLMLAQANKSPNDILNDAVRVVWNKTLDQRVYQGKFGKPGLVNQTVVTAQSAANGATSGTPQWPSAGGTKTALDIFNDFQNAAKITWAACGYSLDAVPDRFLVPATAYPDLLVPMTLGTGATSQVPAFKNILEYTKANYFGLAINGKTPEIIPVPSWMETVGASSSRRLISYTFNKNFVEFGILQDIQRMGGPLSLQDGAFVATYIGNTGIVKAKAPQTLLYQDHI